MGPHTHLFERVAQRSRGLAHQSDLEEHHVVAWAQRELQDLTDYAPTLTPMNSPGQLEETFVAFRCSHEMVH
jgi:hypothetical protein